MTVVYLDAFLALNFAVNYLLLAGASRLDGAALRRSRCALAAALGAVYGAVRAKGRSVTESEQVKVL